MRNQTVFKRQIRPIVLGLVKHQVLPERLLVCEFTDPLDQRLLYRAPGGGIEFGESSNVALQREFWEELGAELANIR
ncbi:MAG: NUDIX domain-containing protein [Elainella sp.]